MAAGAVSAYGIGVLKTADGDGSLASPYIPAVALEAAENVIGKVVGSSTVLDLTLSLDTSAYASGDVLADTQEITNAFRVAGGVLHLQSVVVLDEDDQQGAFDLIFLDSNVSLGTENAASSITDANARKIIGRVSITASDYTDLGGCDEATMRGLGLTMKAAAGSTSLFVGVISRDTKTYTASGIKLKLGVLWD